MPTETTESPETTEDYQVIYQIIINAPVAEKIVIHQTGKPKGSTPPPAPTNP